MKSFTNCLLLDARRFYYKITFPNCSPNLVVESLCIANYIFVDDGWTF